MEEKFERYPILEIEYNKDGTKKPFYILASEKDIKNMQIKSDRDELENKYSMKTITKEQYEIEKEILKTKYEDQNTIYDYLIFNLIRNEDVEDLRKEITDAKLNEIELKRLASSLSSIAENKINDFIKNNKEFKQEDISLWNAKYDLIAKNYAKTRELESFILGLIE
ncbi:MAG: hypothetical protein J5970_04595 [Bacilli bacterium]|nr:hypothetical protein [Bacilli bacterium]